MGMRNFDTQILNLLKIEKMVVVGSGIGNEFFTPILPYSHTPILPYLCYD
jgi:hypothetical protein